MFKRKNKNKNKLKKEINSFNFEDIDASQFVYNTQKEEPKKKQNKIIDLFKKEEAKKEIKKEKTLNELDFKLEKEDIIKDSSILLKEVLFATNDEKNKEEVVVEQIKEKSEDIVEFIPNKTYQITVLPNMNNNWEHINFEGYGDIQFHMKYKKDFRNTISVIITERNGQEWLRNLTSLNIKGANKLNLNVRFQNDLIFVNIKNRNINLRLNRRIESIPMKIEVSNKELINVN